MLDLYNPKGDLYYKVGKEQYYNQMLAMQESQSTGTPIEFSFFEELTDTFNWNTDYTLTHTWEQLLADRAREIRLTHKKVRIWFSGGRDSWLVLKAFIDNNIFIDEIAVVDFRHSYAEFPFIWEWLLSNKAMFNPATKIVPYRFTTKTIKQKFKKDFGENPNLAYITPILTFGEVQEYLIGKKESDGTAEVSGLEKPKLNIINKKFEHSIFDSEVRLWIGTLDHVPFFISKTVPLYQYSIHYMKNYIKQFLQQNKITDFGKFNSNFYKTADWYKKINGNYEPCLSSDEGATKMVSPHYEDFCAASLRDGYAHEYLGNPHIKTQAHNPNSTRINTKQWETIETLMSRYYPNEYKNLKDSIQLGYAGLDEFFGNDDPSCQPKLIKSKSYIVNI